MTAIITTNWQKLRQQVLGRDNFTCQMCSKDAFDVHHKIALLVILISCIEKDVIIRYL